MKFDSYQRFLKSDLYRECLQKELKGEKLPRYGESSSDAGDEGPSDSQLKPKSEQTPKRRSLSLWPKISSKAKATKFKNRSSKLSLNRKSLSQTSSPPPPHKNIASLKPPATSTSLTMNTTTSSSLKENLKGPSTSTQQLSNKETLSPSSVYPEATTEQHHLLTCSPSATESEPSTSQSQENNKKTTCQMVRVVLPDRSTAVVKTMPGKTIGEVLYKLLDKKNMRYSCFDAFATGTPKVSHHLIHVRIALKIKW